MKLAIVALTVIASSAFAKVTVSYQRIGNVPANQLCDAGSTFQTLNPVTVCDKYVTTETVRRGEWEQPGTTRCVASHKENLTISKDVKVCAELDARGEMYNGCTKFVMGTQSSTVVVERVLQHGEVTEVAYSSYTIPACN